MPAGPARRGARRTAVGIVLVGLTLSGCTGAGTGGTTAPSASAAATATSPAAGPASASPTAAPTPSLPPVALEKLGSYDGGVAVLPVPGQRGHLLLAQRSGSVLLIDDAGARLGLVLNLSREISQGGEQGLLSLAVDPSYVRNHRIYVAYTTREGSVAVEAYTVEAGAAVRPQRLLTVAHPYNNHNGGQLLFDRTGMLLVGVGDGGNAGDPDNRAQDPGSLLGKILRIDPRTGAPAPGNPWPQNRYVWAIGLRNPWRFSFGPDGTLYLGDVGQNRVEELDVVPPAAQRGANYGWSVYEGDEPFKPDEALARGGRLVMPALTYLHTQGGCAVTAGEVYAGAALPWLRGRFVYGDYCQGHLMAVTRTATGLGTPVDLHVHVQALQAFGHDDHGNLLVMGFEGLYRLVPGA